MLTDGGDDGEDEEWVEYWHDGGGERLDDVAKRAQPAEEPHDPEGPQRAERVGGQVNGAEGDKGEDDDEEVEDKRVGGQIDRYRCATRMF